LYRLRAAVKGGFGSIAKMQAALSSAEEAELTALAMLDADGEAWRRVGPIVRAVLAAAGIDSKDIDDNAYEPHQWANGDDDQVDQAALWAAAEAAGKRMAGL